MTSLTLELLDLRSTMLTDAMSLAGHERLASLSFFHFGRTEALLLATLPALRSVALPSPKETTEFAELLAGLRSLAGSQLVEARDRLCAALCSNTPA